MHFNSTSTCCPLAARPVTVCKLNNRCCDCPCVCALQVRLACMTWRACCLGLHIAALGHYQLPCPAQGCHRSASWLKLGTIALDTDLTHPRPGRRVSILQICRAASTSECTLLSKRTPLAGFTSRKFYSAPQTFGHNLHT